MLLVFLAPFLNILTYTTPNIADLLRQSQITLQVSQYTFKIH
jgi:hypothetical protein